MEARAVGETCFAPRIPGLHQEPSPRSALKASRHHQGREAEGGGDVARLCGRSLVGAGRKAAAERVVHLPPSQAGQCRRRWRSGCEIGAPSLSAKGRA